VAVRRGVTPAQVALAWLLHQEGVVAIPKAAQAEHVRENRAALELELTPEELKELGRAFPPPKRRQPLEII
jgi:diketogulonate reductase-like aldo/keto reductase